ncbi:hypothetical protein P0Y35_01920 [Kiritimatiellaeota bacterium B1221]|nr:hypothetical protein [Kiritimatiellaeota bacterium B1221]
MTDTLPPPRNSNAGSTEKKGRNCWLVGCGGCLGVLALFVIISMVAVWQLKRSLMVEPFVPVELSASEETRMREKLESLNLLDAEGKVPDTFEMPSEGMTLSEAEVNYWISRLDDSTADSVRVDFEPEQIIAELRLGNPGGKRLMVKATIGVPSQAKSFDFELIDLKLGNFSVSEDWISKMTDGNTDLSTDLDPETQKELESKVDRIEILKDEIRFIPKNP